MRASLRCRCPVNLDLRGRCLHVTRWHSWLTHRDGACAISPQSGQHVSDDLLRDYRLYLPRSNCTGFKIAHDALERASVKVDRHSLLRSAGAILVGASQMRSVRLYQVWSIVVQSQETAIPVAEEFCSSMTVEAWQPIIGMRGPSPRTPRADSK